ATAAFCHERGLTRSYRRARGRHKPGGPVSNMSLMLGSRWVLRVLRERINVVNAVWKVLLIIVLSLVLLAGTAAAAAWRYDAARNDRLAKGIVVAGVNVGGMRLADARTVVARRVGLPLEKPIAVRYKSGQ